MDSKQKFQMAQRLTTARNLAIGAALLTLTGCAPQGYGLPDPNRVQRPATQSLWLNDMLRPTLPGYNRPPPPGTYDCRGARCTVIPGFRPYRLQPAPGRDQFYLPPSGYQPYPFYYQNFYQPADETPYQPGATFDEDPIFIPVRPMSYRIDRVTYKIG